MYSLMTGARVTRSVHARNTDVHAYTKAFQTLFSARTKIDEEEACLQVPPLVLDFRVNFEFNPRAANEGRRARPRAFERRDAHEVMSWKRVPSVVNRIVFMRLRLESNSVGNAMSTRVAPEERTASSRRSLFDIVKCQQKRPGPSSYYSRYFPPSLSTARRRS